MSRMDYYSNELEDDFIEIDDTSSSEEYHASEEKEKEKEKKKAYYDEWKKSITSHQPSNLYAEPWRFIGSPQYLYSNLSPDSHRQVYQSIGNAIDAQVCNAYRQDLRTLANTCQTQQIITNPTNFIQQQLNTSCNNVENGLRNVFDAISKIMEN